MGLSLAVFHCDIIDWRLGDGGRDSLNTNTRPKRGFGMGTDPKDNSYHDNSPGMSDLFAADTGAANNR